MSNPYSHLRVCDAHHLVAEYRQQAHNLLVALYDAAGQLQLTEQLLLIAAGRKIDRAAANIEDAIWAAEMEDQAELADREGWKEDTR